MRQHIDEYLADHESAWALTTWKSERSRLLSVANELELGPEKLFEVVKQRLKPYSIKTLFIRICDLEKWIGESDIYQEFMQKHTNRFKHAYTKEELEIGYEEALNRLDLLPETYRRSGIEILLTGVRISEAYTVNAGNVVGKGGKTRRVYGEIRTPGCSQSAFRAALKTVGLKPHTLRKLAATRLASKGASPADLCRVFGWSSIATAYQYLQPQDDQRLMEMMK